MNISFIIPAYNEESYVGPCLASLLEEIERNGSGLTSEIIVVDNASTDRTREVAAHYRGVTVLYEGVKGTNKARQRGFEVSRGDIVAYLDADTRVLPGWIPRAFSSFEDPSVAAVSGPYRFYDFPPFWEDVMWVRQTILGTIVQSVVGHHVVAGNMAVRRSALSAIGGFDTDIPFYGDDADIGQRLTKVGRVLYLLDMEVQASARRYKAEGILKTTATYGLNYLSVAFMKRPFTRTHKDIR